MVTDSNSMSPVAAAGENVRPAEENRPVGPSSVVDTLLDVLVEALPYVEFSLTDPAYKAGAVQKMVTKMRKAIALAEGKESKLTDKEKLPDRQRQILNYIALRKNKIFSALPMGWECSREMMTEAMACVRAGWLEHRNEGFGDEFRLTDAGRAVLAQSQEGSDVGV